MTSRPIRGFGWSKARFGGPSQLHEAKRVQSAELAKAGSSTLGTGFHSPKSQRVKNVSAPSILAQLEAGNALRLPAGSSFEIRSTDIDDRRLELRNMLGASFGIDPSLIALKAASVGRSGDAVFLVSVGGEMAAVLKVFRDPSEGAREAQALSRLEGLQKFRAVENLGEAALIEPDGTQSSMLLMENAGGSSVASLMESLPSEQPAREQAVAALSPYFKRTGEAFGEFHLKFQSGLPMSADMKHDWANWVFAKIGPAMASAPRELRDASQELLQRAEVVVEQHVLPAFLEAEVPATAYHGDATLFNFVPTDDGVRAFDVSTLEWSLDASGHGERTGAVDLGRFLGHLRVAPSAEGAPALTESEAKQLEQALLEGYAQSGKLDVHSLRPAITLARIEFELAILRFDPGETLNSLSRLRTILNEAEASLK